MTVGMWLKECWLFTSTSALNQSNLKTTANSELQKIYTQAFEKVKKITVSYVIDVKRQI